MGTLYGEYTYVVDAKNRVFVPARFREELHREKKDYLMMTIGLDKCLYLYLPSQWDNLISNNMEIFKAENKEDERAFKRFFFGNAMDVQLDEQGRILISQIHKKHASLKKNIIIRGVGNKAEIWDSLVWKAYKKEKIDPALGKFGEVFDL